MAENEAFNDLYKRQPHFNLSTNKDYKVTKSVTSSCALVDSLVKIPNIFN